MGLTVSRKTAKNLAVRRKNERIIVSRKKMLTVKKSNHKIRSRDLLLTLMCYAFMCSGNLRSYWEQQIHIVIGRENYYRDQKCRKCVCIICLTDVWTALLFYDFLLSFILTGCNGCIESDSKSLLRWTRKAYRRM